MKDLQGKVAVVTGAASGIGLGITQALAAAGMKVVLADVESDALEAATSKLRAEGREVHGVVTDVSRYESVEGLARAAEEKYGNVHVLCNNAGIATGAGMLWETDLANWAWIESVNLNGVLFGIRAFVPRMIAHGEGGHVVNTASMAGLISGGDTGLYTATKFAVVGLTEALYLQLSMASPGVSASVLCPAWVKTNILASDRNRPTAAKAMVPNDKMGAAMLDWVREQIDEGLDPRQVGEQVLHAIREDRFYILTHPAWTPLVEARMKAILAGTNPERLPVPGVESLLRRFAEMG